MWRCFWLLNPKIGTVKLRDTCGVLRKKILWWAFEDVLAIWGMMGGYRTMRDSAEFAVELLRWWAGRSFQKSVVHVSWSRYQRSISANVKYPVPYRASSSISSKDLKCKTAFKKQDHVSFFHLRPHTWCYSNKAHFLVYLPCTAVCCVLPVIFSLCLGGITSRCRVHRPIIVQGLCRPQSDAAWREPSRRSGVMLRQQRRGKSKNISVMHLNTKAGESGERGLHHVNCCHR